LWWTPAYAAESGSVPGDPLSFNGYPIDEADTEEYMISYYAALKTHTSVLYNDANSGSLGPPHISTGSLSADPAWEYLGDEERFVAAKIGIFRESFIWNTLNIGTNVTTQGDPTGNVEANITLAGGTKNPYLSMGQTAQAYASGGIFLGSGSLPGGPQFSLSGSTGHLLWDGNDLDISGVISASAGDFSGTVTVGGNDRRITIGPGLNPAEVSPTLSNPSQTFVRTGTPSGGTDIPLDFQMGQVTGTDLGDVVEFNLLLDDILSAADPPGPPTYYLNGIIDMVFGVTQSGVITTFTIPDYTDAIPYEVAFTASYASLDSNNITMNWAGTLQFNSNPMGASLSYFTSSLSASVVQPSLAVSNDGIFFDRGFGKESLFALSGGSGGSGGSTYNAGTGLTLDGSTFNLALKEVIGTDGNNRVLTSDDDGTLTGEENLTWDGATLAIVGARDLTVNTDTLFVDGSADKVGINKTPVTYELDVAGTIASDTDVIVTSDIRLKNVEGYVSGGLIIVNNLNPIKYTWKDKEDSKLHIGLSAQEVLQYVPEAVYGSEETQYGVSYGKLVPVLIDAVKELTTRIEELEKQLEDRD
jgi:hypothetical protein